MTERKVIILEQKKEIFKILGGEKMRIAVCDTDNNFILKIKNEIYRYANINRLDIVVDYYTSGEMLLKSKENYNLIFIEYHLLDINGFETAKIIKNNYQNTAIIFMSNDTSFVFEAFKVSPFRFLKKPINYNQFIEALDSYFKKIGNDHPLWIKSYDHTFCLSTEEVLFVEANNKHCYVHLKDNRLKCNKTMARVFEVLPKNHFSKINRAFVVNLDYISAYTHEELTLTNGVSLPISRNYQKTFKEEYRRFSCPKEL